MAIPSTFPSPSPSPSFSHASFPSSGSTAKSEQAVLPMGIESTHDERALATAHDAPERPPTPAPVPADEPDLAWPRVRTVMQDAFSEFFGVFIMILFGDGSVAQVTLSDKKSGDYQSISWGWG